MRKIPIIVTVFAASTALTAAFAAPKPQRPTSTPPAATAPFTEREMWCERYASWLVEHAGVEGPLPSDVRPTQRFENEFNSCKPDPREYERQTRAEIDRAAQPPRRAG